MLFTRGALGAGRGARLAPGGFALRRKAGEEQFAASGEEAADAGRSCGATTAPTLVQTPFESRNMPSTHKVHRLFFWSHEMHLRSAHCKGVGGADWCGGTGRRLAAGPGHRAVDKNAGSRHGSRSAACSAARAHTLVNAAGPDDKEQADSRTTKSAC